MTLLEAIVALVILVLVGVGCLELSAGSSRAAADAARWTRAVAHAESAMEAAALEASVERGPGARRGALETVAGARVRSVARGPGVRELAVTVPVDGGGAYTVRRLVRAP